MALTFAVPFVFSCTSTRLAPQRTISSATPVEDFSTLQKQALFITQFFSEFQKCKPKTPCTITHFEFQKIDPNSGAVQGLIAQEKHFFNSINKKNGKFSSPKDFDNSDSGFPAWAFYNNEFYIFFGMVENGEKFELVNIYKIKTGKSQFIISKDKFIAERFNNDVQIMNLFLTPEKQKDLANYIGTSKLINVDMEEGGSTYYQLSDKKYLCGLSEDSETVTINQCNATQLKAYLKSL